MNTSVLFRFFASCWLSLPLMMMTMAISIVPSQSQTTSRDVTSVGPLNPSKALTIYILNDAPETTASIILRRGADSGDRVLLRAFDEEEKNTLWQYIESGKMADSFAVTPRPTWGIPALSFPIVEAKKAGDVVWEGKIAMRALGIHQIRITSGMANTSIELRLPRESSWGISAQNSDFKSWKNQPTTLFSLVPPKAEELEVAGGPFRVVDKSGAALLTSNSVKAAPQKTSVDKTNTIWKWEFPEHAPTNFRASGFPLILCSDEKAASRIGAGLEFLPDGTAVAHKFQRRIAEILPKLLDPQKVGRAEDLIVPLSKFEKEWLSDPVRNANLLSAYGIMPAVEWGLRHQNVDPQSHWSGSLFGWQQLEKLPTPRNRWDRLKPIRDLINNEKPDSSTNRLWGGASTNTGATAENMARAVSIKAPFNPYFGKRELLYRAAAAALRDLMALSEDETWRGVGADMDDYAGFMAFTVGQKTLPVYAIVAPQMPAEVREVWTEGVERIMDRLYPESLLSTRNQSSHFLVAYQNMAQGSGLPRHKEMAKMYARRWIEGQHPSGFQSEQSGPDASYMGLTHWHEAVYFRESGDPAILDSLRRSYGFFNHTVAPEPNGTILGGFNFNHRVGEGFYNEQWNGARGILDDVLPEVGLWAKSRSLGAREQAEANIKEALAKLPAPSMPNYIANPRYFYSSIPDTSGVWPAQETSDFIRDIDGQLVAFKRAKYYGAIYVGRPSADKAYIASRENDFRQVTLNDAENKGGTPNIRKIAPFLGGGLSMFWTPEYGTSLLATNWSPLTHHGLVAVQEDGKRYWEDYFATDYSLDKGASSLTIKGRISNQPITYTRTYHFAPDGIDVQLKLVAETDHNLRVLWENLPLAMGKSKANRATLSIDGETNDRIQSQRLALQDNQGAGIEVLFDTPQHLRVQRNGLQNGNGLQIGRIEIMLPAEWKKAQQVTLSYRLRPLAQD